MDMDRLMESVKKHEGYRNKVYLDTLGKRTVGVGHLCVESFWEDDKEYEEKFLMEILQKDLQGAIDKSFDRLAKYVNAFEQKMFMKREVIANKGIWTAKKRYILNVFNEEGLNLKEPKLKIMGIEAVKSSTPAPCRVKIKEALKVIMNKDEASLIDFIENSKIDEIATLFLFLFALFIL